MIKVFKITKITIKNLLVLALSAILFGSFAPHIFAMTAEEETALGSSLGLDLISNNIPEKVSSAAGSVTLQLQLLADVSGSVDTGEFLLQQGYSDSFRDALVINKIVGCNNCIEVQLIYWSSGGEQEVAVPWTKICNQDDANSFADLIDASTRPFNGATAPGSAINYGVTQFGDLTTGRQVIDVSGDGAQNNGADTSDARDAALAAGIDAINGIYIGDESGLATFYDNNIKGGVGSFTLAAATFADFTPAIAQKLLAESCPTTVGGESLNINMTSLFVAGFFSNALWIAPVAVGIAGTGLYLARSKIK